MNKKSRLLLPTIGLVVLSGIAATSTTFAWFTTVRSATVEFTKAKVVSTDSSLQIAHAHSYNSTREDGEQDAGEALVIKEEVINETNVVSYTGEPTVTDISGDGKTFYKPIWAQGATTASSIPEVPLANPGDADGKLIDFTIKISRSDLPGAEGIKVYLGANTEIRPVDDQVAEDVLVVKGVRMSVYESTETGVLGDEIFVHAPEVEAQYNYIKAGGGPTYGVADRQKDTLDVIDEPFTTESTNALAAADYPAIAYLEGSESGTPVVDAYVNFRFWVEGEDSDTTNTMLEGEFEVNLDLYALAYNA